jgi:MFS family permease
MASLQPVAGRLGDRLGRRRLILGGLIGFGLASLGATVAPNLVALIVCRVAQAVSGAIVLPNGDALLREIVPDHRRASRFGMIGAAIGLAAAIGPPLGGILVSTAGWRAMFAVNLLLVVPALYLSWRTVPGHRPAPASGEAGLHASGADAKAGGAPRGTGGAGLNACGAGLNAGGAGLNAGGAGLNAGGAGLNAGGAGLNAGGAGLNAGGASPTPTGSAVSATHSVGASLAAPSVSTARPPFDWPGAVMLSGFLIGLALLLSRGGASLSGIEMTAALIGLAALLILFFRRELRHPEPVLQPRFFSRPAFARATGAVGLSNLAMYTVLLAIPILWARAGRPAAEIGALLGGMSAAMFVAAPMGGRLADRFGRRWPTVGGLAGLTLGAIQIAVAGVNGGWGIALGLVLIGGGLGLATPGLQVSALEAIGRQSAGAAAGAYSTSRYLGSIVGSALLAGLVSAAPTSDGVGLIFAVVIVAAGLSALLALGLPHRPASKPTGAS